jgi:ATP-dependent protease ClpP protease subunit
MPTRIEIRGIIVGAEYDASWAEPYISRGVITPESRVRKALAAAQGQDVELYINSYGGSVFDGNEMLNMLKLHRASGSGLEIIVGALAASMAAVITVCSGAKVKCFKNTKLMFHGATTETYAGKQAHLDSAALLGKINSDCMQALTGKFGVPKATVDSWYAEGRMGWLTADEAKNYGIVSEILDSEDTAIKITKDEAAAITKQGLDIAACADIIAAETSAVAPGASQSVIPPTSSPDAGALTQRIEQLSSDLSAAQTALTEMTHERDTALTERNVLKADLATAKASAKEWQSKFDKLTADHAKTVSDLSASAASLTVSEEKNKTLNARLLKVAASTFCRTEDGATNGVDSIATAVNACGGDTVKARQKYPEVFSEYRRVHSAKRKGANRGA